MKKKDSHLGAGIEDASCHCGAQARKLQQPPPQALHTLSVSWELLRCGFFGLSLDSEAQGRPPRPCTHSPCA